ncbi:ribonuclease E activity regulator RraA [Acinetobacter sp. MD2(2019)]|uniref:ribonuclease E activity regulator RraA n=1 Tax=Acinetobacter sp. MD2(2019) TaxID=2605273 RepID=UPI002D1E5A5D|nr:ribonuclease E activity regulator RraA [Acinetobacter sp. MD2(2019)]MEB3754185.1 ribonuclease E activity regulator RraA [Acinetobacter sp. MD2(2019)]
MVAFITCDLLDDNPNEAIAVIPSDLDGKFFKSYGKVKTFFGEIVTVKCFEDNSRVKEILATDGTGKVLLVDGGASMNCALMGDMIAESAVQHGWNGVIIYGCVRDVDILATLNLGIFALAATPKKSLRQGVGDVGVDIHLGGIQIKSGQYVYADNNGILIAARNLLMS